MNIFKKRPLSLILCIMLGGFSLFANSSEKLKLILAVVSITIFLSSFIFDIKSSGRIGYIRIALAALAFALLLSSIWSSLFYPQKYYGEMVSVEGKIYDIDLSSYNAKIELKTSKISGRKDRHTLILYTDRDTAAKLKKYDVVNFYATLHEFNSDGDISYSSNYYTGNGISGYLDDAEQISILDNRVDKIDNFWSKTTLKLSNTLKKRSNFETGAFLSALIIGNREDLDGNTRLNFSRAGISHILALSGMHLAILSVAITKFLSILRVNKKYRVITVSVLTFIYMAMTGFSPSVVRAGIMLIITGILYLLSYSSDSITSLFIAVAIILIFTPHAALDLSLWLSAFATLGVIVFSEYRKTLVNSEENQSFTKRFYTALRDGILVSVFAFSATFAISVFNFKTFSIISIFSTLIFALLVEVLIYLGLLALAVGWFVNLNAPLIFISDFIKILAECLSDIKFAYVSADSLAATILLCAFSALFFIFLVIETKKKKLCLIILCAMLVSVFTIATVDTVIIRNRDDIIYSPDVRGDAFLVKSDGCVSIIYSGKFNVSSAYTLTELLEEQKITYLDNLVLANYSYSSIQFCEKIIDILKTDRIYIPYPETDEELNLAEGISDLLSLYGTDMRFYKKMQRVRLGEYSYSLVDKAAYSYGDSPMNVFKLYNADDSFLYITYGQYSYINVDAKAELYNCEKLIVGTSGNYNYNKFDMVLPNIKVIISQKSDSLTDDAIKYYSKSGAAFNCFDEAASIYKKSRD